MVRTSTIVLYLPFTLQIYSFFLFLKINIRLEMFIKRDDMIVFITRLAISTIFFIAMIPKLFCLGKYPGKLILERLKKHRAGWIDIELFASHYVWTKVWGYPEFLQRVIGMHILICLIALNTHTANSKSFVVMGSLGLVAVLGGGIYTWIILEKSFFNCLPAILTLIALSFLLQSAEKNTSYITSILLSLLLGVFGAFVLGRPVLR